MKILLTASFVCISLIALGQELTKIKVSVPNHTDEVYITGNQDPLGNWNPGKIKLNKTSAYEREISLDLTFPAEFKFTRGGWDTEGYTSNFWEATNLRISSTVPHVYNILSWKDQKQAVGSFHSSFNILNHFSSTFNEDRTVAIKLPKNFDTSKKYPVVYVLDANTLLKPFVFNSELLSEKFISEDGTDYERDNIPEIITVGIFHNNRGYETGPKFDYTHDISLLAEGSEKLKNYLFNELVPMINSQYPTAHYDCIVGHSNTGHFVLNLPFFQENPFEGIIALSINTESKYFKDKVYDYIKASKENIFIGYGTMDNGFNELGELLNEKIKTAEISNPKLKAESFEASHNQLPSLALSSGIKFIFRDHKNLSSFKDECIKPDFSVSNYLETYKKENEKYGAIPDITGNDLFSLAEIAMKQNNVPLFREVVAYSNQHHNKISNHLIFWIAQNIKDYQTADGIVEILSSTKDEQDIFMTLANFKTYANYLLEVKNSPRTALTLLQYMHETTSVYKLEFAYYYAKTAVETHTERQKSKQFLAFCRKHFKENRIFKLDDLDSLSAQ